jgi:hypothetical protein
VGGGGGGADTGWWAQSTNTIGYLVPTDEWESGRNGGYEESVSIDQYFGDVTRDLLLSMVLADNANVAVGM